ncbi:MAG: ROK family transcriptional regulator [Streptosporangiaceae bacterium]
MSERAVLHALFEQGAVTRPELADHTGLSKPTVSEAIRRLVAVGLVGEAGRRRGRPGRVATYYSIERGAGFVVGVDIGGENLRVAVADLAGERLYERRQATRSGGASAVTHQAAVMMADARAAVGHAAGPLRRACVSIPGVVHSRSHRVSQAYNIGEDDEFELLEPLRDALGAPITLENNVNLAALGEQQAGLGRDVPTFAFISVGAGIGMGLVYNGKLVRGANGAAGEVAHLPLTLGPAQRRHGRAQLEAEAGGYRMLAEVRGRDWPGTRPDSVEELFAQAAAGNPAACELVEDEGKLIGLTVASACLVFDPALVVLGGGVGHNPMLLPIVRDTASAIAPFPPRVEISSLGERASLEGALAVALRTARHDLLEAAGRA